MLADVGPQSQVCIRETLHMVFRSPYKISEPYSYAYLDIDRKYQNPNIAMN